MVQAAMYQISQQIVCACVCVCVCVCVCACACTIVTHFLLRCFTESTVVDGFPEEGWYPRFHCLQQLLWQMYHKRALVHHITKQALAALDQ